MTITNYENSLGEPMVMVVNDDGTTWSGTKAAYDEMTAASTLPSNSAELETKPAK